MTTCCPNCSATTALGGEVVSVCTECASVSVAGASMGMTTIVLMAIGVAALAFAISTARKARSAAPTLVARTA